MDDPRNKKRIAVVALWGLVPRIPVWDVIWQWSPFSDFREKKHFGVCYFGRFCHLKFSPENFLIVKIRTSHSKLSALYNAISIMQIG